MSFQMDSVIIYSTCAYKAVWGKNSDMEVLPST